MGVEGALKPSLEGWKLDTHGQIDRYRKLLETFLRGMETGAQRARTWGAHTLKPSLEGWKLGGLARTYEDRPPLKPSLEGWKHK